MSDEITPERLDALLDGSATPETESEREMLHLAARMRDGSPRASDALRRRVQTLESRSAAAARPRKRRWRPVTSRDWLMIGAPALSALLIAVIGVGVLTTRDGSDGPDGAAEQSADSRAGSESTEARAVPDGAPATTFAQPTSPSGGAVRFATVDQLNAASTDVVVGVVGSARREVSRSADGQLIQVVSPFAVTRVVRGRLTSGQSIDIVRSVRADTGTATATADAPELRADGEYVVFLVRVPDGSVFTPLGPDSAWAIAGDRVSLPGSAALTDSGSVEGRTVDEAVATLRAMPVP